MRRADADADFRERRDGDLRVAVIGLSLQPFAVAPPPYRRARLTGEVASSGEIRLSPTRAREGVPRCLWVQRSSASRNS